MKATTELNKARANKLHSDAINRMIVNHEDELDILNDEVDRYKRVALNLVATIVLLVIIGGYAYYLKGTTPVPIACEQEKSKPSKKGKDSYVIEEYTLRK
jgi:hypothetical protein